MLKLRPEHECSELEVGYHASQLALVTLAVLAPFWYSGPVLQGWRRFVAETRMFSFAEEAD